MPPIRTPYGWLTFYHGVSSDRIYRVGAILLDLNDPSRVTARTEEPLLEPSTDYEGVGCVNSVVFPRGSIPRSETVILYYGAADNYVCATTELDEVLSALRAFEGSQHGLKAFTPPNGGGVVEP